MCLKLGVFIFALTFFIHAGDGRGGACHQFSKTKVKFVFQSKRLCITIHSRAIDGLVRGTLHLPKNENVSGGYEIGAGFR